MLDKEEAKAPCDIGLAAERHSTVGISQQVRTYNVLCSLLTNDLAQGALASSLSSIGHWTKMTEYNENYFHLAEAVRATFPDRMVVSGLCPGQERWNQKKK